MNNLKTEYTKPETTLNTDIQDLPEPTEILSNVANITKDKLTMDTKELDIKYKDFKNKYYSIYKLILTNDDLSPLYDMLKLIQEVKNNKLSIDTANKYIGQTMAQKYIPDDILNDTKKDDTKKDDTKKDDTKKDDTKKE